MNCMTDTWAVFGRDQGQAVEVAYRYDYDTDCIIRRTHDRSDNTIRYSAARYYEGPEWNGSEGTAPFDEEALEWTRCDNPFAD